MSKEELKIKYIIGDATKPIANYSNGEIPIIIHCCNNRKAWGRGFVLALSKKYPRAKEAYFRGPSRLGTVTSVMDTDGYQETIVICNIVAQNGYGDDGKKYIEYNALEELEKDIYLDEIGIRLHMIVQNGVFITLYSIGNFYIEKRFIPLKNQTKIVAYKNDKKLHKFIKRLRLPKNLLDY